ncbi:MAG: ABC transporter substrate-binding protein [Acidobacteria bacterium]|nr:ABC transporter substrate-binding protein [Acidobacteriota bacterium]
MIFGRTIALCAVSLVPLMAAEPVTGGILRVAQRAEPRTFNPVVAIDAPSRDVLRRMHADLITIDRSTLRAVPALAESWTQSRDGKIFRIRLRPDVRFSDGHAFTAEDVAFTFAVHQDAAMASPQRDLLVFEDKPIAVRVKGPLELEFELPRPYAAAERLFDSIAMLPRHQLESAWKAGKLRQAWTLNTPPEEMAVLGPFRLKRYKPGESVLLERNPYFWQRGRPYLDGIEFRFLPDEDTQLAQFVSGHLDILNRLQPRAVQYLESRQVAVSDLGPSLEYNFVCFNLTPGKGKPMFQNVAFRRALSEAVDRRGMARVAYQERAAPIWNPVSPANTLWSMVPQAKPNHDVALARKTLEKAGFRWDAQGRLLDEKGQPFGFSLLVSASSAERIQMANVVAADWKELGLAVRVTTLEFRSLLERVTNTREFDTVLLGLGGGDADPNPEMNVWLSSGSMHLWDPNQRQARTKWEGELDQLMRQQMVTVDYGQRRAVYHRALRIIEREQPMIFLVSPHVVTAQSGRVGGFQPAALDHYTLWNAAELFLVRQ